jgi:hypothetical protein
MAAIEAREDRRQKAGARGKLIGGVLVGEKDRAGETTEGVEVENARRCRAGSDPTLAKVILAGTAKELSR